MTATLTFRIPQTDICIYEAFALAQILNDKPLTRRGNWVFTVELDEDELCWNDDETGAESAAWKHWTDNLRPDVRESFGQLKTERIEECIEIDVTPSEDEAGEQLEERRRFAFES